MHCCNLRTDVFRVDARHIRQPVSMRYKSLIVIKHWCKCYTIRYVIRSPCPKRVLAKSHSCVAAYIQTNRADFGCCRIILRTENDRQTRRLQKSVFLKWVASMFVPSLSLQNDQFCLIIMEKWTKRSFALPGEPSLSFSVVIINDWFSNYTTINYCVCTDRDREDRVRVFRTMLQCCPELVLAKLGLLPQGLRNSQMNVGVHFVGVACMISLICTVDQQVGLSNIAHYPVQTELIASATTQLPIQLLDLSADESIVV